MRITVLICLLLVFIFVSSQPAVAVDPRAQEVVDAARRAIGGDELRKVQSLIIKGQYRRLLGERQLEGEREISVQLPDKYLVEDSMNPGGMSTSLIVTRGLNGEHAWNVSSGGGGTMFFRIGPPGGQAATPEQMEATFRRQYQIEMTRYLLALLVSPSSLSLNYTYAGESEVDEVQADVVEVTGPEKFAVRLFFDKQSHLPLLLSYRGPKPRIMTMTRSAGPSEQAIKKAREEAEKKMDAEQTAKAEEVDFFIRVSDHKREGELLLPHKLTFSTGDEASEEFEISKYKINPQFTSDKFQKH